MKLSQGWQEWRSLSIREQITWARRILPLTIFVTVGVVQLLLNLTLPEHQGIFSMHLGTELFMYAVLGPMVTWYVLLWIERQLAEKEQVERRFREQEQRMIQLTDDVRAEIANDLHDTLGPNLYATALKAEVCRKLLRTEPTQVDRELAVIHEALKQSIREVRRAVYALRPVELERVGIFQMLRKTAADFEEVNQTHMQLTITGEEKRLPNELETGIFHIIQEALHNVSRHAGAKNVAIHLEVKAQILCLRVMDDGRGFDLGRTKEGVGLRHMRERVEVLEGTLNVRSSSDQGTEIFACLPLPKGGKS